VIVWPGFGVESSGLQREQYGPAIRAYLSFLRHEESELEFQISHREISRKDYDRAMSKLAILRQTVIDIAGRTGEDVVPELHVVTISEVDQLFENGATLLDAIKDSIKPGDMIADRWQYVTREKRGEVFYVFKRLPSD
jgi:hypothetical protein